MLGAVAHVQAGSGDGVVADTHLIIDDGERRGLEVVAHNSGGVYVGGHSRTILSDLKALSALRVSSTSCALLATSW